MDAVAVAKLFLEVIVWFVKHTKYGTSNETREWIDKRDDKSFLLVRDTAIDQGDVVAAFHDVRERFKEFIAQPGIAIAENHCFAQKSVASAWVIEHSSGPNDLFQVMVWDDLNELVNLVSYLGVLDGIMQKGNGNAS